MDPQLEAVIILQDLDLMIAEATDSQASAKLSQLGFTMDHVEKLQAARADVVKRLSREVMRHYERLSKRYTHRVVPVQANICLGCFMAQPTQFSSETNNTLRSCQSCSRILYSI
jgi:predicted  nucleic acid-binding Zn-ribbon protein